MRDDADLIQRISRSEIYSEYERAFGESTELPLRLPPIEFWKLPHQNRSHENPFCALLSRTNRTCASCLELQQQVVNGAKDHPSSVTCFAGLCDTAVPIKLGERVVGFLVTGQVALKKPSKTHFKNITQKILEWGSQIDLKRLEDAYFHSKVLSPRQYEAAIRLLEIFGKHLSLIANQIAIQSGEAEPPMIRRAKAYIAGHHADPVSLHEIANAVHVSTFYFCKMFKKATGMTFTDYVGRVRVEKVKNLLLNPHLRVSEIAYAVGFHSLTHFNRVFRELTGESPTRFRAKRSIGLSPRNAWK